jgi:hypothetical protein
MGESNVLEQRREPLGFVLAYKPGYELSPGIKGASDDD